MPARHTDRTVVDPIKRGLLIAISVSLFICVLLVSITFLVLETIS